MSWCGQVVDVFLTFSHEPRPSLHLLDLSDNRLESACIEVRMGVWVCVRTSARRMHVYT
jgi:hypothetical protein